MPAGSRRRVAHLLIATALVASALPGAAVAQDLPSDTPDGTVLTSDETTALLHKIKDRLDEVRQPSEWIDALLKDLPGVRFADDLGDTQAMYQPVSQGPLGRSGDTLYLRAGLDLNALTHAQLGLITHEMWHAWFDFVPTYVPLVGSAVGRMSNAQDEAMGGFVEQLAVGNTLGDAISGAIAEVLNWEGTVQDAVSAIDIVEKYFDGSFFANGLATDRDVLLWARVRHRYPEVLQLEEAYLSETDQRRVGAQVAILVANDARGDDPLLEPDPAPAPPPVVRPNPGAPALAPSSGGAEAAATAATAEADAAAAAVSDAAEAAAVAIPDCTPCIPIARKLADATRHRQTLQTEADQVNRRLGQIPAELTRTQQARDDLQAEYERRLRQTRVRSGGLEAGYYEVGSAVYIGLGSTVDGRFVPTDTPDPNAPPDFGDASGPVPSPYMTRLKAKRDAADKALADLRAEQARLNARLKLLTTEMATAQAAIDALAKELAACLETCGMTAPLDLGLGPIAPAPLDPADPDTGSARAALPSGNPTDLLSGLHLYALRANDDVPSALARPDYPGSDQYQLFVVSFIRTDADGDTPVAGDARGEPTARRPPVDSAPARPVAILASSRPGRVVVGGQTGGSPALTIVATGASSGHALTLETLADGGPTFDIVAPDGLVLQAVRPGAAESVVRSGQPTMSTAITGFCLEYGKPPPPPGTVYQVAPDAVQQRFRAIRPVLEAGRALAEADLLHPDSAPDAYATFIRQWAVWTRIEGWDEVAFTREFIAHTQRNVEDAGQAFTDAMRGALAEAAPNRFRDILAVLVEADGLTGRLPFVLTP